MKVFISWSGERSKQVAELMDEWMQCVIQAVDPWLSSKDIDRGALWFSEINNQLADTQIGIVCLTKQNKEKPWILFESGALAKGLSSNRVCTFLIDLEPADIANPLAQFNHTLPNKDSLWQLVQTLNVVLDDYSRLNENILEKVFDTYYPIFEDRFAEIIKSTPEDEIKVKRKNDDMMVEVLSSVRMLERRLRSMESVNSNSSNAKQRNKKGYITLGRDPEDDSEIAYRGKYVTPSKNNNSTLSEALAKAGMTAQEYLKTIEKSKGGIKS